MCPIKTGSRADVVFSVHPDSMELTVTKACLEAGGEVGGWLIELQLCLVFKP